MTTSGTAAARRAHAALARAPARSRTMSPWRERGRERGRPRDEPCTRHTHHAAAAAAADDADYNGGTADNEDDAHTRAARVRFPGRSVAADAAA